MRNHRTEIQIALLLIGVVVWGYGQRMDVVPLQYVGIGCFALAAALRLLKPKANE